MYIKSSDYVNRKGFHSLQLQAVCDGNMMFIDIYCGWPGSVHDARVLRVSPLYANASTREEEMFQGGYLIGDRAYPLKSWLMTIFRDGSLSADKLRFNNKLMIKRQRIEHAFPLLKGRFRKLKVMMDIDNIEDGPEIVKASCVLHNIALLTEDQLCDYIDVDEEQEINNFLNIYEDNISAQQKRQQIMDNL